jgi:hypothetical protein
MDRQRVFLGLRITTSVFFGAVCLLLIGLWVRSYSGMRDGIIHSSSSATSISMEYESLILHHFPHGIGDIDQGWHFLSGPVVTPSPPLYFPPLYAGFGYQLDASGITTAIVPLWSFVLLAAVVAAAPWVKRRYSLRTLLIATTLIAILMGLISAALSVYAPAPPDYFDILPLE